MAAKQGSNSMLTFPWKKIQRVVRGDFGSGDDTTVAKSRSSTDLTTKKKNVAGDKKKNQKNASSQTILEQRTRNWYRRHLDHYHRSIEQFKINASTTIRYDRCGGGVDSTRSLHRCCDIG
eukprot:g2472.t1